MANQRMAGTGKGSKSRATAAPQTKTELPGVEPTTGSAFIKPDEAEYDPTRPATFDLPGFISGAVQHNPRRIIPVTYKPEVAAEAEACAEKIKTLEAAPAAAEGDEEGKPRRRMAQGSPRARMLAELRARYDELVGELVGTWAKVKIRPVEPGEQDEIRAAKAPAGIQQAALVFSVVALVGGPDAERDNEDDWSALSAEQWLEFINAIGPVQYHLLDKAYEVLSYGSVTPDFYERFSASLATRSTS